MIKGEKQLIVYYLCGCKVWMTNIFFVLDMCLEVVWGQVRSWSGRRWKVALWPVTEKALDGLKGLCLLCKPSWQSLKAVLYCFTGKPEFWEHKGCTCHEMWLIKSMFVCGCSYPKQLSYILRFLVTVKKNCSWLQYMNVWHSRGEEYRWSCNAEFQYVTQRVFSDSCISPRVQHFCKYN